LPRAIALVLMTLVAPGSAQWFVGHRGVGRLALQVWATVLAMAALLAVVAWLRPELAVAVLTNTWVLATLRLAVLVLGVGWLALLLDAWRLARPLELPRNARLTLTIVAATTFALLTSAVVTASTTIAVARDSLASIFGTAEAVGTVDGRYNVLVLGGDSGAQRSGMRPDSLTVVSVDADTGRAALIGIPRNLQNVPFPADSPLAAEFPNGYDCGSECMVNALYTWGEQNRDVVGSGVEDPGLEATRLAAEGVTGLQIPYTVVVDMKGFAQLVDAMGGVSVDIGKRIPMGGGSSPVFDHIEPGLQRLTGFEALWFARSREGSSDYERMARQKCLTASLARQLNPVSVLRNFQQLAASAKVLLRSDIPASDLPAMVQVAQVARSQPIDAVSLVPPLVNPAAPDYDEVHAVVQRVLAGEPAVEGGSTAAGDGSVGNSTSSAAAALTGSVSEQAAKKPAAKKRGTAAERGVVCLPV
jgi:LCP family protein required for cell wall assembly